MTLNTNYMRKWSKLIFLPYCSPLATGISDPCHCLLTSGEMANAVLITIGHLVPVYRTGSHSPEQCGVGIPIYLFNSLLWKFENM